MLDEIGMAAFANRARRDLRATGDTIATQAIPITPAAQR